MNPCEDGARIAAVDSLFEAPASVEFGRFRILPHRREVLSDGRPIELGGRAFDLLMALVEANGTVVGKDELISRAWPGRIIEEGNLRSQMRALRAALGDPDLIRTVAGRGYQFAGVVRRSSGRSHDPMDQGVRDGATSAAPRLSIVVLPFISLSDDREQQYLADGITEDLTTDLSRLAEMSVISRNTAFTYRNKSTDTKQIGRELGVRYVLEGSVRRSGGQVRISAQLIDAATDAHLWAERLDHDIGDLLALQDEITSRIANELNIELIAAETARPIEHPDALDYILRGRAAMLKPESRDSFAEAISLFEHALALDPQSVEAQTRLAGVLAGLRVFYGASDLVAADLARADALIDRALAAAPRYALAHHVKGQVLRAQNRWAEAIIDYETALASNPNLVVALNGLGWCKLFAGSIDEVIPLMEQATRRSPRDSQIGTWHGAIGMAHLLQSRIDEAIVWLEKARNSSPEKPYHHLHLSAAYALSGDLNRAALELAEARRLDAGTLYSSIAHLKAFPGAWWGVPEIRDLYEATYFTGLRKAGMPKE